LFVIRSIAGIKFNGKILSMEPQLPEGWKNVKFGFAFRKNNYTFEIFPRSIIVEMKNADDQPVEISISGKVRSFRSGERTEIMYQ